jgi:hypothetical protein
VKFRLANITLNVRQLASICVVCVLPIMASADSYDIEDVYWGANHHGHGDVIGHDALFDIHGANVIRAVNITIDIFANFVNAGLGSYPSATASGNGIGFGDLFLADEWTPDTSKAHYKADNYITGTDWDYGF